MRYTLTLIVLVVGSVFAYGQSEDFKLQEKVFRTALKYNDGQAAKQALFQMIALEPSKKELKDTLAQLYFQMGAHLQCVALTTEILKDKEDNALLEMKAVSETNLGAIKEGLKDYETLFQRTQNVMFLYEIATLQYRLKRFGEGAATTDAILANEKAKEGEVVVPAGQGRQQKVPLLAAVFNLRGVMAMEMKESAAAKQNFEAALKSEPKFLLAQNNLKVLQQAAEKKAGTPAPEKKTK